MQWVRKYFPRSRMSISTNSQRRYLSPTFKIVLCLQMLVLFCFVSHITLNFQVLSDLSRCKAYKLSATVSMQATSKLPSTDFYIKILNSMSTLQGSYFDPQINATELLVMTNLLWAFLDLCEQNGVQVMLYGGTLLGSYRHHGVLPWDDDIDLLLKESDKNLLIRAFDSTTGMALSTEPGRWKVWNKTACFSKHPKFCWPYLDLSFYRVNNFILYDTQPAYGRSFNYPVKYTFPLIKRPFMGRWVDSPRDALRFLSFDKTPSFKCISLAGWFSHRLEKFLDPEVLVADCSFLAATYPFVIRVPHGRNQSGGVIETLRFQGDCPIYKVMVDEPVDAINTEYSTMSAF